MESRKCAMPSGHVQTVKVRLQDLSHDQIIYRIAGYFSMVEMFVYFVLKSIIQKEILFYRNRFPELYEYLKYEIK